MKFPSTFDTPMEIPVNNGGTMKIYQDEGKIWVKIYRGGKLNTITVISEASFVLMYDWYVYQIEHGNPDLNF